MIEFDIWWNSAAADSFRAKHEDMDGEQFRPVWDAAVRAATQASAPAPDDFAAHTVLSGVARHKVKDLIASGYRICGYTMERVGHRSAVVFDAAVRWLDDEQRHTLMFVEGARVQAPAVAHDDARDAASWREHQEVIRKTTQHNTMHLSLRANINGVYNTRDGVFDMGVLNQQIGDPGETVGRTAARYYREIEQAIAALGEAKPPVQGEGDNNQAR